MKKLIKFKSLMQMTVFVSVISITIGCFGGSGNYSSSNSTYRSQSSSTDEYITECFLGFKFDMSQYEVQRHLESLMNDDRYEGECVHNGSACFKFKLGDKFIYLYKSGLCDFYEGQAYKFIFEIDNEDFYTFLDAYKNSKNHFDFHTSSTNKEDSEAYNFKKNNLSIWCHRIKTVSFISYTNDPIEDKVLAEKDRYKSDY